MLKQDEAAKQAPSILKLAMKLIKYHAGGLDKAERQDLFADLLLILAKLAEDAVD